MSSTREVIHLLGVTDSVTRTWSTRLDLESVHRANRSRQWTNNDFCQLLIGQKLTNAGFSVPVALAMVREMARHFVTVTAIEAPCFLLAWQDEAEPLGWGFNTYLDREKLINEFFDRPTALVLNIKDLLEEALLRVLSAGKANASSPEATS